MNWRPSSGCTDLAVSWSRGGLATSLSNGALAIGHSGILSPIDVVELHSSRFREVVGKRGLNAYELRDQNYFPPCSSCCIRLRMRMGILRSRFPAVRMPMHCIFRKGDRIRSIDQTGKTVVPATIQWFGYNTCDEFYDGRLRHLQYRWCLYRHNGEENCS